MPPAGICFLDFGSRSVFSRFCNMSVAALLMIVVPIAQQGPLVGLRNFHPSLIRWCLMHVVHLGLLFVCNGSGLPLT